MSIFLSFIAILIALFAWACLFKLIPDSLMAMFRHRLWRERDALAAEVRSGVYSNAAPAEKIMRDTEGFVELAPQLSPLHLAMMRASEVGISKPEGARIGLADLHPEERERLEARMGKISNLVADHILLETPSGWLTLICGVPVALVVVLFRRLGRDGYGGTLIGGLRRRFSEGASDLACREHLV
jgi:hypothetical protein